MNKPLLGLTVLLLTLAYPCAAQSSLEQIADSITREGRNLYFRELAAWNGTDIIIQKIPDKDKIGGYFSYLDHDTSKCIFVSNGDSPRVIGSVSFDDPRNISQARVDLAPRAFTDEETQLFLLRSKAREIVGSDTFYTRYQHTAFNLIPIIEGGERKVIVLTGPQDDGVIILGNDYQLNFDEHNQFINVKKLHQGVFLVDYGNAQREGQQISGGEHTHSPQSGDFITATDICTLMLYEKYAKWQTYYVMSVGYVSMWDCKMDRLFIMTQAAWNRIYQKVKRTNSIGAFKANKP